MDKERKYYLRAFGQRVEVTEAVYRSYYKMNRHERYLEEKDGQNGKILYNNLDTDSTLGEEMIPDRETIPVEEQALMNLFLEIVKQEVDKLSHEEQEILHKLFWEGKSERQAAAELGIPRMTLNTYKHRILKKLRRKLGAF